MKKLYHVELEWQHLSRVLVLAASEEEAIALAERESEHDHTTFDTLEVRLAGEFAAEDALPGDLQHDPVTDAETGEQVRGLTAAGVMERQREELERRANTPGTAEYQARWEQAGQRRLAL